MNKKYVAVKKSKMFKFDQYQFICDLYELEQQGYILQNRIKKIDDNISRLKHIPKFEQTQYKNEYNSHKKVFQSTESPSNDTIGTFMGGIIGFVAAIILDIYISFFSEDLYLFFDGIKYGLLIFLGCIALGYIYSLFEREKHKKELNKHYIKEKEREDQVNEFNVNLRKEIITKYDNYIENLKIKNNKAIEKLKNEKSEAIKSLNDIHNTLNELYSLRINGKLCLHPNYQGLLPISIIFGYFDTGRCTTLEGHEGAYNLYEEEKIKGIIINKLDIVSKQLGQLQSSMTYIGKALENCNSCLAELESKSNKIINAVKDMDSNMQKGISNVSNQMKSIDTNTANSAYYSKVSAEASTFSATYDLLKS